MNKESKDLLVGQFVLVKENETIPADMIIAASDRHKSVYLDMTNLLGFSITDTKEPIEKTSKILNFDAENPGFAKINGKLFLPEPNSDYNNVTGTLKLDRIPGAIEIESVNVLFQGGILKGDSSIIGLIMYCGSDTKIQLNTNPIKLKHSRLEKIVNIWVFYILLVLRGIVFFSVIGYYYIGTYNKSSYAVIEPMITFMLLYNNIIPISLFIVIDIIRLAQC